MSFLKKLLRFDHLFNNQENAKLGRSDIRQITPYLRQKFSRGVQYNMKIVIRGDRNVGKSALLARLKGEPFIEQYIPSTEIQVANVHWSYKDSPDVIKLEAWDVVDRGKPRSGAKSSGLVLDHCDKIPEPCLDASFLDVYHGAHGVILVLDITKAWTLDYIRRELPKIPVHVPILIMANHRDMGNHRTVTEAQVRGLIEADSYGPATRVTSSQAEKNSHTKRRPVRIQYCEASMRNGFGLLYVHKFLSLPFLCLQRSVLREQLIRNQVETHRMVEELETDDGLLSTGQTAYELYLKMRRERAAFITARQKVLAAPDSNPLPSPMPKEIYTCKEKQSNPTRCKTKENSNHKFPVPNLFWSSDAHIHQSAKKGVEQKVRLKLPSTNPMVLAIQDDVHLQDLVDQPQSRTLGFRSPTDELEFNNGHADVTVDDAMQSPSSSVDGVSKSSWSPEWEELPNSDEETETSQPEPSPPVKPMPELEITTSIEDQAALERFLEDACL